MADNKALMLIEIIEKYENISRNALAYNMRKAMGYPKVKIGQQDNWLAKLYGITRETAYSWFAPGRHAKVPLKVVARISLETNTPFMTLLEPPENEALTQLRMVSKRNDSYERDIIALLKKNPDLTVSEIATQLGIATGTVRRHLKNYKAKIESMN